MTGRKSIMTSAQIIAALPMCPDFSTSQVNKLCREGKLYGYKVGDGNFEPWIIPEESFALYLLYNPVYLNAFKSMDFDPYIWRGTDVVKFVEDVKKLLKRNWGDETYTISQLSYIFDVPKNQILAWFKVPRMFHFILWSNGTLQAIDVVQFLERNPKRLEALKERHKLLLAKGGAEESAVRHLLMLHAYYKSNGYLT